MRYRLFFIILIQLVGLDCWAGRGKYFSIYPQYHHYTDIVNNSGNEFKELEGDIAINLEIRLVRIFSMTLVAGSTASGSRTYSGLGFKTDLPGFFLLGGKINDLIHKKRRRGINTYFAWTNHIVQEEGQGDRFVGNRFSLGADVFVSKSVFLNMELGLYSLRGDQFLSPTLGFGVEF